VSANHRTAGFSVLERLSGASTTAIDERVRAIPGVEGAVVLSTCNRVEVYVDSAPGAGDVSRRVTRALADAAHLPLATLDESTTVIRDRQVPEYLFAVSSGLESVVVGEGEISGQVGRALEDARELGATTARLEKLFQTAATTSKGVKGTTDLHGNGRSLVRLGLDLAESRIRDWARADILLIGTGAYAGASLKALRERGVERVHVYSPSGRANRFAEREHVDAVSHASFAERLSNADLVVTCTAADDPILDYDGMRDARIAPGRAASTLIIDLGMPRNVDPTVAMLDGVELLDLETIRLHAPLDSFESADEARCIVARAAAEFAAHQAETSVSEGIATLRRHVHGLVDAEAERAAPRDDEGVAAESVRRLANAILHEPSVRVRRLAREGRAEEALAAIELLFGLRMPELGAAPHEEAAAAGDRTAAVRAQAGGCPYAACAAPPAAESEARPGTRR